MIGGSLLPDASSFVGDLVDTLKRDVGVATNSAVSNVRTDLANAVSQAGAGLTDAASQAIAPSGRAPVLIPFSATQLKIAVAVLVIGGCYIVWHLFRGKR